MKAEDDRFLEGSIPFGESLKDFHQHEKLKGNNSLHKLHVLNYRLNLLSTTDASVVKIII